MYFAWVIGRVTEQIFGTAAYAVVYFGSGLLASLVSALWQPIIPSVGASGALFGVFGAFLAFTVRRRSVLPEDFVRSVRRNALVLIGVNLAIGFVIPGIDVVAHIGGLVAGFGVGYLIAALAEKPVKTPREAKLVRVRAVAAASLATTLVLVGGALAMPRWDDAATMIHEYDSRYAQLVERYSAAESPERIALIESEFLPLVREAELQLRELDRVPKGWREPVDAYIRYYELRQQAFELEIDALRNNDEIALAKAEDLHAEANATLE
jgi:hypothetical protein